MSMVLFFLPNHGCGLQEVECPTSNNCYHMLSINSEHNNKLTVDKILWAEKSVAPDSAVVTHYPHSHPACYIYNYAVYYT